MSTVYIVNNSGQDFSAGKARGELVALSEGIINIFAVDRLIVDFKAKLKKASWSDYLLLCGSPILNAIAMSILLQKNKVVNCLLFNVKTAEYQEAIIRLDDVTYMDDDIPVAKVIEEKINGKRGDEIPLAKVIEEKSNGKRRIDREDS